MKLRIGHLSTLYHTSIVMMARPELLEGVLCEVQWNLFGTGPAIVNAFEKGEIDMAYIGLPPAIIGISRGVDIVCIAGGHIEGTVIAAAKGAKGYPESDNLKEILSQFRCIGVPGKGSIHDLILTDAIHSCGLSTKVRNLPWADEVLEAFMKGEVDAVVGTPALAEAVRYYGNGKIVYPPELLWPDNPSYGILVRRDLLSNQKELVREFLIIHEKASEMLRTKVEELSSDIARMMGVVNREFVINTIRISPHYCSKLTEGYIRCSMQLADRLRTLGYIEQEIQEELIFDTSLINEIHPEESHYRSPIT